MKRIITIAIASVICLSIPAQKAEFPLPTIPSQLTKPAERANYLALHYWDLYNFEDLSLIGNEDISEQGFCNYISIMPHVTQKKEAFDLLISKLDTKTKMLDYFIDLAQKYLTDPQSPVYDEELYILMLESLAASEKLPETKKEQLNYKLSMSKKNRVGSVATDFEILLRDGKHERLSNIDGEYILLYFGDPDCNVCNNAKNQLLASTAINKMVSNHTLTIVSICVEGKTDVWEATPAPQSWIDACDEKQVIYEEELYEMASIPSFYLLNSNHHVMLRDVPVEYIIKYLQDLQ